jgi:hypothetical protein
MALKRCRVAIALLITWVVLGSCQDDEVAPEPIPPGSVSDLAIDTVTATSITLSWTAPGDDGDEGRATSYQLKWSGALISSANFDAATTVPAVPAPAPAGTVETFTVAGLDSTLSYFFAIRSRDGDGLYSAVSNNASWAPPPPDSLRISSISPSAVSPGEIIVIHGSNFATPPGANQVVFTNPLSMTAAFAGNTDSIQVVVDQDATSGPITVTTAYYTAQSPSVEIQRGIGDFFIFGGLGAGNVLSLPTPTATTQYLIVPHGTNASAPYANDYGYEITSENNIARATFSGRAGPTRRSAASRLGTREAFDAWRWDQARDVAARVGAPARLKSSARVAGPDEAPPYLKFYVLDTVSGSVLDPGNYTNVTADLRYIGTKCLVYADVDTLADPANNFDQIHFQQLGQAFDNPIEATNVQYFGTYSDVDGNGKVIILISPVVNRLTPDNSQTGFIAGFFLSLDLYQAGQVPAGTTNHAEIFYLLAADPGAQWGNPFPIDDTAEENIGTTAHEHEHMISFSHRIFNEGGSTQETWLEEGMAHMAEDLNGMHGANINRADIYLQNPGAISLEHATAPLSQRGGIYLFLRLLVDRYGPEILQDIVQSPCRGRACIQDVTGENFYDLVAEFFAALYLSGKGITTDARFNYWSIDLADYGTVAVSPGVVGLADVGEVRRSSGDFYLYGGVSGIDTRYTFTELIPGVRLRNAIVRVQ